MPTPTNSSRPWQQHTAAILGIGLAGVLLVVGLLFLGLTGYYWWQIKQGRGVAVEADLRTRFTAAFPESASGRNQVVNRAELETADDPTLGSATAPVTIVEFVDFKCPNCKAAAPILDRLIAEYGSRVRLIARDFPVESLHPGATRLSEIAACAHEAGRYWMLSPRLLMEQDTLPEPLLPEDIARLAEQINLPAGALEQCLGSGRPAAEVQRDYLAGIRAGVRGTPTFFINGVKVEGVIPWEAWQRYLQRLP